MLAQQRPEMLRIAGDDLQRFYCDALEAEGASSASAEAGSLGLIYADLHGIDTHGAANLERIYLSKLRRGEIAGRASPSIVRERQAVALLDANRCIGFLSAATAADMAVEKALQHGIGAVGVRNSSHCGCVGQYTERAVLRGMIGLGFTNLGGEAYLPPPNGTRALFGTNVLAAAAPSLGFPHFNLDMSAAVVSTGRIREARDKCVPVPSGWLADSAGRFVTDPAQFFAGTAFLQFLGGSVSTGSYKGFGLAMLIDILCGLLCGGSVGPDAADCAERASRPNDIGHFFVAIDIEAFGRRAEFLDGMDQMLRSIVETPAMHDSPGVSYPGQPQQLTADKRRKEGVPLSRDTIKLFAAIAQRLEIRPLASGSRMVV
jgi:LDH2 family malate/lactate/ureidoglycolate dehydrogenase